MKPPKEEEKSPTEWIYVCGKCPQTFNTIQNRDTHRLTCQQPSQSQSQAGTQGPKFEYPANYQFPTGADES